MITYQDRLVVAIVEAASMADSHGLVRNIVADVASGILDAELSLCHDIPGILCRKPHSLDILLDDRLLSLLNRAPQLPVLQATITSHILDYLLEILPDDSRGHLHVRNVLEMLFFGAPLMLVGRMVNDELQWDSIQDIVAALDDSGHPGSRVPLIKDIFPSCAPPLLASAELRDLCKKSGTASIPFSSCCFLVS